MLRAKKQGYWARVERTLVNQKMSSLLKIKYLFGMQSIRITTGEGEIIDYGDEEKD